MRRCLRDPTFSRFDTIPECDDRDTDTQTHRHTHRHTTTANTALSIALRGKIILGRRWCGVQIMFPLSYTILLMCISCLFCEQINGYGYGICRRRVSVCLSVCLSVCVSVTLRYCIKTAKRRITQVTPHDSPGTLVF